MMIIEKAGSSDTDLNCRMIDRWDFTTATERRIPLEIFLSGAPRYHIRTIHRPDGIRTSRCTITDLGFKCEILGDIHRITRWNRQYATIPSNSLITHQRKQRDTNDWKDGRMQVGTSEKLTRAQEKTR
jgi:hypothetical protein